MGYYDQWLLRAVLRWDGRRATALLGGSVELPIVLGGVLHCVWQVAARAAGGPSSFWVGCWLESVVLLQVPTISCGAEFIEIHRLNHANFHYLDVWPTRRRLHWVWAKLEFACRAALLYFKISSGFGRHGRRLGLTKYSTTGYQGYSQFVHW